MLRIESKPCRQCGAPVQGRPRHDGTKRQYIPARCEHCRYTRQPPPPSWFTARIRFESSPLVDGDCWVWTGARTDDDYALYRGRYLHRLLFHKAYGFEPDTVDHLCRNHPCINPRHLESVTLAENLRRGLEYRRTHPS